MNENGHWSSNDYAVANSPSEVHGFSKSISLPSLKINSNLVNNVIDNRGLTRGRKSDTDGRFSEEDVRLMMDDVMQYCRALQTRVQDLEVQLIQSNNPKNIGRFSAEDSHRRDVFDSHQRPNSTVRFARLPPTSHDSYESAESPSSFYNLQSHRSHSMKLRPLSGTHRLTGTAASTSSVGTATSLLGKEKDRELSYISTRPLTSIANELVVDIDHKVAYLKEIFKKTDPIEQRRISAIKIQATIRGFVARARLRAFKAAIRDWRWMRCRPVIWLLDILLANQSKFDSGFHLLTMNRTMRTLVTVFNKWAIVCRQNAPVRYQIREAAAEKIEKKKVDFMRSYFNAFRTVTTGRISLRHANKERREMIDKIRKDLSNYLKEKGLIGIVPPHEIQKMLHRRVIDEFKLRKKVILMQGTMNRFRKLILMTKRFERASEEFRFRKLVGRCFFAWSDHTYLSSLGLDRKRWPGPRKYEVRYNQKRVDNFARLRCEKLIFDGWKAYFQVQITVKRKYQKKLSEFIGSVFRGWRVISAHYRKLRKLTYENWTGYSKLMVQKPFQAWAEHVKAMKNRYQEHLRIAKSYMRWKERQRLLLIVKVWRHQALFGRIDGLYTRQMLLKTVADQKIFITSLEKTMADQTMELEECKQMVLSEIDRKNELETEIQKLNQENNKLKMANHNFEQELKRLESIIQAMIVINPKQMEHLKKMQPEFKFKERNIALGDNSGGLLSASNDNGNSTNPVETETQSKVVAPTIPGDALAAVTQPRDVGHDNVSVSENDSIDSTNKIGALLSDDGSLDNVTSKQPRLEAVKEGKLSMDFAGTSNLQSGDEVKLTIDTKADAAKGEKLISSALPTAEHSPTMVTPHANSEHEHPNFNYGPAISTSEQRMLERAAWVIKRYKTAWPTEDPNAAVQSNDEVAQANNEGVEENANDYNASNDMGDKGFSASYDGAMSYSSHLEGNHRNKSFASVRSPTRNSLLRGSNPFLKVDIGISPSRGESFIVPPSPAVATVASRQPSISRQFRHTHGMGSFRSSFSRNFSSAIAAAVQAVENLPGDSANNYYSDNELEEIVILWAKMLFTILEFLDTGDITNLPKEDKRLWAEHLLEQARHVSEVPYDVLYERDEEEQAAANAAKDLGSLKSGLSSSQQREDDAQSIVSTDTEKIAKAVMNTTMITVDQLHLNKSTLPLTDNTLGTTLLLKKSQPDAITWREGLLRLRTMFPGAGNFSGFGVGIEAPEDTALFQRLLKMREDLKKIENVQTLRYQRQFYESQRLLEQQLQQRNSPTVTTPSGKKVKAFKASGSPIRGGGTPSKRSVVRSSADVGLMDGDESLAGMSLTSSVETDHSLHLSRPLGTNVYAGNLKKLLNENNVSNKDLTAATTTPQQDISLT